MKFLANIINYFIQLWIRITGKTFTKAEAPWLFGPYEEDNLIGNEFYERFAKTNKLVVERNVKDSGLMPDFTLLDGVHFKSEDSHNLVKLFYENTSNYKMEIWSQWYGYFSVGAKLLIGIVSKQIEQLNIPLNSIDTSRGMSSEIIKLNDADGQQQYACWFRKLIATDKIVYAGFYTTTIIPKYDGRCVKVVFPLPKGNAVVILKPVNYPDGSFSLISDGKSIGEPGYYRVHYLSPDKIKVRYLPMHEDIHLFVDKDGVLRTDHVFKFHNKKLLHLHYKVLDKK